MKKFFLMAMMACATITAFAQFRVEAGFISQTDDGEDSDISLSGLKVGGYYMLNDVILDNGVLEAGVTFQMASGKENGIKYKHMDFAIPINAGYAIQAADDFIVRPYLGINLKLNTKFEASNDGVTLDLLDKDIVGSDIKKFQFGGQVGAVCQWNKFTLGYQFQQDFGDLYKDLDSKFVTHTFSVGYIF